MTKPPNPWAGRASAASPTLGAELVALYRAARAAAVPDFKAWSMARARQLLPLHSTHWVNGVMTDRGAVFHHVSTEGLRAGYWEHFQTLMPIDPVGPRMFASPGTSMIIGYDDFPARIRDEIMVAYGVREAVLGMAADPSTGTFSVVCWYRDPTIQPFTEADRRLHEQLLPHWVECLNLHRVGRVLRDDLHAAVLPGSLVALVEGTGLIHYAQLGFGELIAEEFPGWPGTSLPAALREALSTRELGYEGVCVDASWRPVPQQLWMVHARRRGVGSRGAQGRVREQEVQLLNASLDERERQLEAAHRALLEREKREAVAEERQRLLRELHDGVGAHLVGLRSLLRAGSQVTADMTEALECALDEMRLAVDSMHAAEGNLVELLATLRWRMQPRLEAAGIELDWSMPDPAVAAAACTGLGASAALQVQRLLLEAFTNILRHARASRVSVRFECRPDAANGWRLLVRDNGVGLPSANSVGAPTAPAGVGLLSMARRAATIGAGLEVVSPVPGAVRSLDDARPSGPGTELKLAWPRPPTT